MLSFYIKFCTDRQTDILKEQEDHDGPISLTRVLNSTG